MWFTLSRRNKIKIQEKKWWKVKYIPSYDITLDAFQNKHALYYLKKGRKKWDCHLNTHCSPNSDQTVKFKRADQIILFEGRKWKQTWNFKMENSYLVLLVKKLFCLAEVTAVQLKGKHWTLMYTQLVGLPKQRIEKLRLQHSMKEWDLKKQQLCDKNVSLCCSRVSSIKCQNNSVLPGAHLQMFC